MRPQAVFQALVCLAAFALQVTCQFTPPYALSPFTLTGALTSMTLGQAGPLGGGTITVDGIQVTVPRNLLATLPSITVGWGELFVDGVPQLPGTQTWQATVLGNRVNNQMIAGLVYIAQMDNRLLQGFIEDISLDGTLVVNGRNMRLNDPVGRFGMNYTEHPLWTVDPDAPSVRSSTGFPMCVPRSANDPRCPAKNRPNGNDGRPIQKLTFLPVDQLTDVDPDPRLMMPLAVGDYITYSGIDLGDLFLIYSLDANLGIYTAPGTQPAYVTCEEAQYAFVQNPGNGEDAETRAVAFTTDRTASIQMYAMDFDPCAGALTKRNMMRVQVESTAPVGRAVFRGDKTDYSPAPRYVGFEVSTGTSEGPDGIVAGEFIQPIFEYIPPELFVFGDPEIPIDFSLVPYLARGAGPFEFGNFLTESLETPLRVGQLDPWPGLSRPAAPSCPPLPTGTPTTTSSGAPSTTLTTSTSTTTETTAAPGPSPDTVAILSVIAERISGGDQRIDILASSNNLNARLQFSVQGRNPAPLQPMNSLGAGRWQAQITVKNRADSVTVESNFGGRNTQTVPR